MGHAGWNGLRCVTRSPGRKIVECRSRGEKKRSTDEEAGAEGGPQEGVN